MTAQSEGGQPVKHKITYYNLDLILALGYRVRSPRGVQFRQWASTHLKEFLRKGFVMDDERLKNPKMGMIKPNMGTTSTTSSPRNLSDALFSGTKQ